MSALLSLAIFPMAATLVFKMLQFKIWQAACAKEEEINECDYERDYFTPQPLLRERYG